jgi:hypothetical protein
MADKKSLVEEALLQMKNLEEVVAENAKGILASTMKGEIAELVKESLKKETDEQEEDEMGIEMDSMDDMEDEDEMEIDMDMDDEDDMDVEDMEDDMEMDFDMDSEDEQPIDLTNASDEEILKVFKSMGDEDGIIVKKDNNQITLEDEDSDEEYIIQLEGDVEDGIMDEEDMEMEGMEMEGMEMEGMEMEEADDLSDEDLDTMMADIFGSEMEEEMYNEDMEDSYEMEEEEDMEEGDVVYEITMDEDDEENMEEDESVNENKFTVKPKMGTLKKSSLTTKAETKEGSMMSKPVVGKGVKTGTAKFEYKEGKKMETKEASIEPKGKAKGVGMNLSPKKFEYKEGKYGMNKGDESKTHKGDEDYTTKKGDTLKRKAFEKEETTEAARTLSNGTRNYPMRKGLPKMKVKPNSALSEEVVRLREKNEEYRKALNVFREKLNEVAVFNSNLAYATRLFTEHTTTKQEKINILRRFDDVESLKESKSLYGSIKNELTNNNQSVVTESMSKIEKSPSSGSAQNLIESKTYENPQFLRMKDIMSKIVK